MSARQGFTLIEIIVVLFIIGLAVSFTLPSLIASIEQSKAQAAQSNLLAIAAAEQKYYEDQSPNAFYTDCPLGGCGDDKNAIDTNLHLSIPVNDPFSYSCTPVGSLYSCTAGDGTVNLTLTITAQGVVSINCVGPNGYCPATSP